MGPPKKNMFFGYIWTSAKNALTHWFGHKGFPMKNKTDDQYTKTETERRFTAALGRALTTPHKPQIGRAHV